MDRTVRDHLVALLQDRVAHMNFDDAVVDFPVKYINSKPPNVKYTFWHLIEHIRFTQKDSLEYMINARYKEAHWPDDYWPKRSAKATKKDWDKSIRDFRKDLKQLVALVNDPKVILTKNVPTHKEHTLLRSLFIIIDHNAYHIGELAILRQVVGAWPEDHK